jgi:hypothetical protein
MTKRRLERLGGSFSSAVSKIASALAETLEPKDNCKRSCVIGSFRLPMVTAILTVLYPLDFTVYDICVCDGLGRFHNLAPRKFLRFTVGRVLRIQGSG